jgi:hypothetical protein
MGKIIRLTESDLIKIVKRVLKEDTKNVSFEKLINDYKNVDLMHLDFNIKNSYGMTVEGKYYIALPSELNLNANTLHDVSVGKSIGDNSIELRTGDRMSPAKINLYSDGSYEYK